MRVVRTVAGLVLLTIGLPVLLVGGALWTLMQHRDAGGAFSGSLEPVSTSGRAIVVPDVDALLREDAPFVRAGDTALRLSVRDGSGPVFLGLAPAGAVRDYLAGADYSRVDAVTVGRGDLPARITPMGAAGLAGPVEAPGAQSFWTRQGSDTIDWTAADVDGREMSLVVMRVDASAGLTVDLWASARSGWLPPTAWSLLALGVLLLGSAIAALVWPVRTRELVFVVDPSQVPQVSARLGAATDGGPAGPPPVWPALPAGEVAEPVPVLPGSDRPADGAWPDWPSDGAPGRPATLADALAGAGMPVAAPSGPAWPPTQPGPSAAWPPVPDGASAWSRAEAARLAGVPAVSAVAARLSVESVPTSGAPAGSATALPIPSTRADATPRPRAEVDGSTDSDARTPAQRSAGSEAEGSAPAKVAHLRSVKSDDAERPAAKRATRTTAKKRPVVFVDTATEPTGESPDRPIVPPRSRATRATKTATKRTPQPREATSATEPAEGAAAKAASLIGAESAALQDAAAGVEARESTAGNTALDAPTATVAPATTAKGSRRAAATKPAKRAPVDAVAAEPTTSGTEVIESTGSDSDDRTAAHGPASAGAPVGTGAIVNTTGAETGEATKTRRTTRAKKAADPAAAPAKATRAPRRKTTVATEEPAPSAGEPATRVEVADKPVETGTPFGGLTGSAAPAKPRRRKTAAGLPAPEATDAGPAHTAVAALVAKRPTTRRPATKASTKRPAADNRATPTDQAS